jgi:hypothetical protein
MTRHERVDMDRSSIAMMEPYIASHLALLVSHHIGMNREKAHRTCTLALLPLHTITTTYGHTDTHCCDCAHREGMYHALHGPLAF